MVFDYIERISNLLRAEERKAGAQHGLQTVQIEVLYYLFHCNRFSNTPAAVTEYMQLTKGTVSQTIRVIESKGLIEKQTDPLDKRVVHLLLTAEGKSVLASSMPPPVFKEALANLGDEIEPALQHLLLALQQATHSKGFGVCNSCKHCKPATGDTFFCGLTNEPLSIGDIELICREHSESS
ncbi:MarR family transcriptional regulator [Oleiphilus messinensis]|uniref:MarR family transcriptional regulator n=1 Tax=Oleiphilus messinensis TaxID=141451 RepID=A0A1Y0I9Y7_9GAMM|nr:MarR family winged helix-turn-helix transcriptional regulator [Oleiphilus messinensis]ARU57050.1 MarR family transcriptional regulator [Oleiphilus messinensis]